MTNRQLDESVSRFIAGVDQQIRESFRDKSFIEKNTNSFFSSQPGYALNDSGVLLGLNFCDLEIDDQGLRTLIQSIQMYASTVRYLLLSGNRIVNAEPLTELSNIEYVDLSWNRIQSIDCFNNSKVIRVLLATNNDIAEVQTAKFKTTVSFKWQNDFHESGIYLNGNPMVHPPKEAFIDNVLSSRFLSAEGTSFKETREMRLILIGSGGAGKTSLSKKLQNIPIDFNEPTTKHIAISQAKFGDTTTQIWDFAGQDSMMSVHRFFLAERSMYLLVLDCRREEQADYLLDYIRSFAPKAPIYVVLNKIDENEFHDLDRARLRRDFPQIAGFFRTSCAQGWGVHELIDALTEAIKLDERAVLTLPAEWQAARIAAQELIPTYMDIEDFRNICIERGLPDEDFYPFLEFAENVGFLFNVDVARMHLVYNPKWLVSVVYPLLSQEELLDAGAIEPTARDATLNTRRLRSCIEELYKNNPNRIRHDDVLLAIDVMEKRELCVVRGGDSIYIPDLLPNDSEEIPSEFRNPKVKVVWKYLVLPRYLIHRIHIRFSPMVDNYKHWQSGMLLKDETFECFAWISMDERAQTVAVSVVGRDYKPFIKLIRKMMNDLNDELSFDDAIELFDLGKGTLVEFVELEGLLEIPVDTYHSGKLRRSIQISDILDSFSISTEEPNLSEGEEQRLQLFEASKASQ